MKIPKAAALALLVAGLGACSSITTSVDYDRSADFSQYKTFAWKDVQTFRNELAERRIKGAVERQLSARAIEKTDRKPDLYVVLHPRLTRETQIDTYNTGWGYGWRWGGVRTTVRQIPVGTLIVDLVDTKAKELVWRGTASRALEHHESPAEAEKEVNEAVTKLFDGFPPKR